MKKPAAAESDGTVRRRPAQHSSAAKPVAARKRKQLDAQPDAAQPDAQQPAAQPVAPPDAKPDGGKLKSFTEVKRWGTKFQQSTADGTVWSARLTSLSWSSKANEVTEEWWWWPDTGKGKDKGKGAADGKGKDGKSGGKGNNGDQLK